MFLVCVSLHKPMRFDQRCEIQSDLTSDRKTEVGIQIGPFPLDPTLPLVLSEAFTEFRPLQSPLLLVMGQGRVSGRDPPVAQVLLLPLHVSHHHFPKANHAVLYPHPHPQRLTVGIYRSLGQGKFFPTINHPSPAAQKIEF